MIRVLVVDDHELVRSGISRLLDDTGMIDVVGQAGSGEDAVRMAKEIEPDIILMDIHMPGIGGMAATRKILHNQPDAQVIAVTVSDDNPYASRLLKMGASGYITKGADADEMLRAIIKVKSGQKNISPEIAQRMLKETLNVKAGHQLPSLGFTRP